MSDSCEFECLGAYGEVTKVPLTVRMKRSNIRYAL